jgi:hypothetical protein
MASLFFAVYILTAANERVPLRYMYEWKIVSTAHGVRLRRRDRTETLAVEKRWYGSAHKWKRPGMNTCTGCGVFGQDQTGVRLVTGHFRRSGGVLGVGHGKR